ncbi:MAG: hypothetical protein IH845_00720 [Nanoarchaeota archaeon]|nr:hypothetical protein [Nanoarchaeota archaeon]
MSKSRTESESESRAIKMLRSEKDGYKRVEPVVQKEDLGARSSHADDDDSDSDPSDNFGELFEELLEGCTKEEERQRRKRR